jgi:hypothetical protein
MAIEEVYPRDVKKGHILVDPEYGDVEVLGVRTRRARTDPRDLEYWFDIGQQYGDTKEKTKTEIGVQSYERVKRKKKVHLGKRQQEIVDALRDGRRLWYEVGPRHCEYDRHQTLTAVARTYTTDEKGRGQQEVPKSSVLGLYDRDVLTALGEWPRENCFDLTVRRVELVLT